MANSLKMHRKHDQTETQHHRAGTSPDTTNQSEIRERQLREKLLASRQAKGTGDQNS